MSSSVVDIQMQLNFWSSVVILAYEIILSRIQSSGLLLRLLNLEFHFEHTHEFLKG